MQDWRCRRLGIWLGGQAVGNSTSCEDTVILLVGWKRFLIKKFISESFVCLWRLPIVTHLLKTLKKLQDLRTMKRFSWHFQEHFNGISIVKEQCCVFYIQRCYLGFPLGAWSPAFTDNSPLLGIPDFRTFLKYSLGAAISRSTLKAGEVDILEWFSCTVKVRS